MATDPMISYLVEKLGDSLVGELKFLVGVKEQVEEMRTELEWMQCFLEDADHSQSAQIVPFQSRVFRQWIKQIKEANLDAEDVIDTYTVKLALRNRSGILNQFRRYACIVKEAIDIHAVGSELEAVKSRLSSLRTRLQTYGLFRDLRFGEASSSSFGGQAQLWLQRRTYGHIVDPNVVGLDGKAEEVVGLLLKEDDQRCRVVSIFGMGGLGKTTLAKKVYHNDKIRSHFNNFVWVCVSQQFKPRDVLETIYIELTSPSPNQRKEIAKLKDDEIVSTLYQLQKDNKCFIVLDDIWSIAAWSSLLAAFPMEESATGSKILLTTRNKELADHVDHRRGSYGGLEPLSPDQSRELLQKIAFAGRDDIKDKESKENLGKEMVKHCGGLPLAIVVLGGTLATKETLREWEIVHQNIKAYLRRGKGGNNKQCLGVDGVLSFSYYDLPHQLKPCFLYLCQYPEDHEIETSRLLKMWVAEGFVSTENEGDGEEMIEDVAERYLNELVGRCMIQVGKEGSTGRIKTCRMHDLMRDMCLSKAKEENLIQSIICGTETNTVGRVRRLSFFWDNREDDMLYFQRNSQLRTLILYGVGGCWADSKYVIPVWRAMTNFKLLRMLVVERIVISGRKFSKKIGNLIHLKYLSFRYSTVSYFPSMKKLGCLETLDLRARWVIQGWERLNAIWKMKNLRHLYLPNRYTNYSRRSNKKVEIDDRKSSEKVQTLVNFPPPNVEVSEVVKFPNVRKLKIVAQVVVEFSELLRHKKVEFSRLSSLSLSSPLSDTQCGIVVDLEGILMGCPNLYKLRIYGLLVNIPPKVRQLAGKLTKLILYECQIEDPKQIETYLGNLPNLNVLHLLLDAFKGRELCFQRGSFPQLKSLRLWGLDNLEEWRVDQGAMPILHSLEINHCRKLKMVPEGLKFIATLKELCIIDMPDDFKERVKEGGPDYHIVQHIPTLF